MKKPIIFRVEFIHRRERRSVGFKTRQEARDYFMRIRQEPDVSQCVLLKVELLLND